MSFSSLSMFFASFRAAIMTSMCGKLFSEEKLIDCIRELYRNNEAHQQTLENKDFVHLLVNDIIFYQRPLRSQKSNIGHCSLEFRKHKINKKHPSFAEHLSAFINYCSISFYILFCTKPYKSIYK